MNLLQRYVFFPLYTINYVSYNKKKRSLQQKSLQMNVFSYFIVLGDRRSQGRCFFMVEKWYTNRPFYVAFGGKVEEIGGKWLMKKARSFYLQAFQFSRS